MSCESTLLRAMRNDGLTGKSIPVFLILRELAACGTTTLPHRDEAAEAYGFTPKAWRCAMAALKKTGYIATRTKARTYTIVTVLKYRLRGPDQGHEQTAKNQYETTDKGPDKGPPVRRSSGVLKQEHPCRNVVKPLEESTTARSAKAAPPGSHKPQAKPPKPEEATWVKNILLKDLRLYVDDPYLNDVNPRTGQIRILESYRQWRDTYKNVNVVFEIRSAHSWEIDHPNRVKSAGRVGWIGNWIRRQAREGGIFKNGPVTREEKRSRRTQESAEGDMAQVAALANMFKAARHTVAGSFSGPKAPPRAAPV